MASTIPIDVDQLRRTFEDDEVLAELYAMYVDDTSKRLTELRSALDAGDLTRMSRTGHTLKGSSANVGAIVMRQVASELEAAGEEEGAAKAAELVSALEAEFARVEVFINEFIERAR